MEKTIKIFSIIIILMINVFIGVSVYELVKAEDQVKETPIRTGENEDKIEHVETNKESKIGFALGKKEPFAVLLLGVDTNNLKGRSDTIIVAVVNPQTKEVNLLSIPRDTRVPVNGEMDKITHAHAHGLDVAIETVENALDIPIKYYVKVNFNGFIEMVDAIGGIEMNVEKEISFNDRIKGKQFTLESGVQTLDGYEALGYARFRGDARGDFGRNDRQKEVIKAIIDQSMDIRNLTSILDILKILGDNVDTDMSKRDMLQILISMKDIDGDNVNTIKMEARPKYIPPVSYVVVEDEEFERIQTLLDKLLEGESLEEVEKEMAGETTE